MNSSPTAAPQTTRSQRLFRSLLVVVLVLAFMLIAAVAYLGTAFAIVESFFQSSESSPDNLLLILGVIVVLLPPTLAIWAARRRWLTWRVLGISSLFAAAILTWLAWDDAKIRRPLTLEEIAPAFDGAEKSHLALLEYGKLHPSAEAKAFTSTKWKVDYVSTTPGEPEKWVEFLTKNREKLEADWITAAPQRAWLDRINAFERLGDLTEADFDADMPLFMIWRFLSQRICARASLQALDNRGDDAIATLLPILETSRKLEPSARSLVRLMMARVCQKTCYQTAAFILDRSNPSPAARARLLAALQGGNGPAGAGRIILTEYAGVIPAVQKTPIGTVLSVLSYNRPNLPPRVLATIGIFLYNPRATANLYGDYAYEIAALAEARDLSGFTARQKAFVHSNLQKGGMKNLGGRLMVNMVVPAFQKVVESYWNIEDLRIALQKRLEAK